MALRLSKVFDRVVATTIGLVLVYYAYVKFAGQQFVRFEIDGAVRDVHPVDLVWYFHGYSRPYAMFIALGELVAGVALIIPRTARIGAPLALGITTNIAVIDWSFGLALPVRLLATSLALGSLYLIVRERRAYLRLLDP